MEGTILKRSKCEKDIGVHVDDELKFNSHIIKSVSKAKRIMAIARKTFSTLDKPTFLPLFKGLVRPHLEYAAPVWTPHQQQMKKKIESVQRIATKRLPGMKELEYNERLRKLKLPTLAYRRVRGDMIQVFKLVMPIKKGAYDKSLPQLLDLKSDLGIRQGKGHEKQLYKGNAKKDIKKYGFNFRVCKLWNSLPSHVINCTSVKAFEIALDKHWENQPIMYDDFEAEIVI